MVPSIYTTRNAASMASVNQLSPTRHAGYEKFFVLLNVLADVGIEIVDSVCALTWVDSRYDLGKGALARTGAHRRRSEAVSRIDPDWNDIATVFDGTRRNLP